MGQGLRKFLPEHYRHRMGTGQMVAFDHEECGDTRTRLFVTQVSGGWIFHCHNCAPKMSGFFPDRGTAVAPPPSSTLATIERIVKNTVMDTETISLPSDFKTVLPDSAKRWLMKYDITNEEMKQFKLGYSPSMNRLILPVFNELGNCVFWQGRHLGDYSKNDPKYLSVQAKGQDKTFEIQNGNSVTIVEDIVSAIKVSRYGSAIALLGSYIPDSVMERLKKYNTVNIWLDADKYKEAVGYSKRLREFGHNVTTIYTEKDPKEMDAIAVRGLTTK